MVEVDIVHPVPNEAGEINGQVRAGMRAGDRNRSPNLGCAIDWRKCVEDDRVFHPVTVDPAHINETLRAPAVDDATNEDHERCLHDVGPSRAIWQIEAPSQQPNALFLWRKSGVLKPRHDDLARVSLTLHRRASAEGTRGRVDIGVVRERGEYGIGADRREQHGRPEQHGGPEEYRGPFPLPASDRSVSHGPLTAMCLRFSSPWQDDACMKVQHPWSAMPTVRVRTTPGHRPLSLVQRVNAARRARIILAVTVATIRRGRERSVKVPGRKGLSRTAPMK